MPGCDRLRLEAKRKEEKISTNIEFFQENFGTMLFNSFSYKKKTNSEHKNNFFESAMKDEAIKFAFTKVSSHIADRTVEGIENLISNIFQASVYQHINH